MPVSATEVTIPRLPRESAPRYAARVEYILAGSERTLERVGQKLGKSVTLMSRWSAEDGWVGIARQYDDAQAALAAQAASESYVADLMAHRSQSVEASQRLYDLCMRLLTRMDEQADRIELNGQTLAVVKGGIQTALDISAHVLGVDSLLSRINGQETSE